MNNGVKHILINHASIWRFRITIRIPWKIHVNLPSFCLYQLEKKEKGQERGIVNRTMSECFLEKTSWQLNASTGRQ